MKRDEQRTDQYTVVRFTPEVNRFQDIVFVAYSAMSVHWTVCDVKALSGFPSYTAAKNLDAPEAEDLAEHRCKIYETLGYEALQQADKLAARINASP